MEPHILNTSMKKHESGVPLPAHARSQATAQEYLNGRYQALLMLAGADVIPNKLGDVETALLDLAEAIL